MPCSSKLVASALMVTRAEVAYRLHEAFGTLRCWDDMLADMVRGRTTLCGQQLLPCGYMREGRAVRPMYLIDDFERFLATVRKMLPAALPPRWSPQAVFYDPADGRTWKTRKLEALPPPV